MEISPVVKTSGAEEQTATIFVALELSKNRWLVAVVSESWWKFAFGVAPEV
jgi:hypothetical protein